MSNTPSKQRQITAAISEALTSGLSEFAEQQLAELKLAAEELAVAWVDAAFVPALAADLQARELLILEKHRLVLSGEAHSRLAAMRGVAVQVIGIALGAL